MTNPNPVAPKTDTPATQDRSNYMLAKHNLELTEALRAAESTLAAERASRLQAEWISVDERLPAPGVNVLAICVGSYSSSEHYTAYRTEPMLDDGTGWTWRDSHIGNQSLWFTHWQPLPSKPSVSPEQAEETGK